LEGHPRAEEVSSWIQRLPYPAGRGLVTARPMQPMKLIMMSDNTQNNSNGVNRAPRTQTRGSAPGRGRGCKTTQVDTKRNPCDTVLSCAEKTYIGTWNVRTLYAAGQLDVLLHQLQRLKWSIMGLAETHWTGAGELSKGEYKIIYSGRKDDVHQEGVVLILSKEASKALLGYNCVSSRIVTARFRTATGKTTVVQVYAPTSTAQDRGRLLFSFAVSS